MPVRKCSTGAAPTGWIGPELLAYHFQKAGDSSAALVNWIAAGDLAEQRSANEEAVAHYRSAKRLTEDVSLPAADRSRAAEVLLKLGNAQWQTAGYQAEEVLRSYQEGRNAALALDQHDEAAEAGIRMSQYLYGSCRHMTSWKSATILLRSVGTGGGRPPPVTRWGGQQWPSLPRNAEQTSDVEKKRLALVEVHRSGYVVNTPTMAEGRRVYARFRSSSLAPDL